MIDKIHEISGAGATGGIKGKRGSLLDFEYDESTGREDGLAVSAFAREMARISEELSKIPDVREDRVKTLAEQIENGTYKPNFEELARRLVWAGITESES